MKILLVAEGDHELGTGDAPGALEVLVKKLLGVDVEVECDIVSSAKLHVAHGGGADLTKRVAAWLREAQKRKKDALVLLIDCDNEKARLKLLEKAQEDRTIDLDRALGVAVQTFDVWMLADEMAVSRVLRLRLPTQKNPERIKKPKSSFRNLLSNSSTSKGQREAYAEVANCLDIALLRKRCPSGFAPFAMRVCALLTNPSVSSAT